MRDSLRIFLLAILAALAVAAVIVVTGSGGRSSTDEDHSSAGHALRPLVNWPLFGRVPQRTHYLPAPPKLNPPFRRLWSFNDRALIEFPPALAGGVAYVTDKYGDVWAIRLSDRKVLWDVQRDHRDVGPPSDVTAPVYAEGTVFVAYERGVLVALRSADGSIRWKRDLGTQIQSSPIVVGDTLYVGSDETNLFALDARSGRTRWQFNAPAAIKASPSFDGGRLYVGDYAGAMFCLDPDDGKLIWRTDTTKIPPFGSGGFYSSPAIAFGRVYAARDDGTVYAFDRDGGEKSWSFASGAPIYGSPAVARVPGTPPSVYIGSYDSRLYSLNALSGRKQWSYDVGGQVPGTATVIGHTVYTSSFQTQESIGIDVLTHRKVFQLGSPGYTPMISDGRRLFLIGYFTVHALAPR